MRLLLLALWFVFLTPVAAQTRAAHGLIVKLQEDAREAVQSEGARRERLQDVMSRAGMAATGTRPVGTRAQLLDFGRVLPGDEAERLAAQLAAQPEVEWVAPNVRERRLQAANPPNDQRFAATAVSAGQWWLHTHAGSNASAIGDRRRGVPGFQSAWTTATGGPAAIVAVLDTGIVRGHPDLAGRVIDGYDFVSDVPYANDGGGRDADPADPGDWVSDTDKANDPANFDTCTVEDSSWHGTLISGIIAASTNNAVGVAGINWDGQVLAVRVAGKCGASVTDIVDGMRWAAGLAVAGVPTLNPNPARVINISFGGDGPCSPYQPTIDELAARGVVVVAAAGNEQGAALRPAKCPNVVGVGAVNRDGFKANYSNFGAELTLSTVGGDPRSSGSWGTRLGDPGLLTVDNRGRTAPGAHDYASLFGTSFSAPIVAGTVSLMLSVRPTLSVAQITNGLRVSARPHVVSSHIRACSAQNAGRCICTTSTCGAGLLDAVQAVLYAQNPDTYVAPARAAENIDSADVIAAAATGPDAAGATPPPAIDVADLDDGGGAIGAGWLLALALAVLGAARVRRRP